MPRRWITLSYRRQRAILTDMLPFEVPPTFSNRGFFRFLIAHEVVVENGSVSWIMGERDISSVIRLLFGIPMETQVEATDFKEWGRTGKRLSIAMKNDRMATIPFDFRVSHKQEGRLLSVVHPRNQIEVANFYATYSSLITYYSSVSDFSIRRPVAVSRFAFFKDRLHDRALADSTGGVEESKKEYEQLGSYFVYKKYSNVHRFFESYKYHRCEKKYNSMVQIDVAKCFDSIYTHSIAWAILGKLQTKTELKASGGTFAGRFDSLMQRLNYAETNGIVIGPEFSRIFAEIILQSVDKEVLDNLLQKASLRHKYDYEMFRYVDDYFIFYNDESKLATIKGCLERSLKLKKLSLNAAKEKKYQKPIITEITVAKEQISTLLNDEIDPHLQFREKENGGGEVSGEFVCKVNANKLITRYKSVISQTGVEYADLLNFTFAILENKVERMFRVFADTDNPTKNHKAIVRACLHVIEFGFFIYSASPKVNHTVRICRIICTVTNFLNKNGTSEELKHSVFKYVHDNVFQQLEKNTHSPYREVESLYLLTALTEIGKDYSLPESLLLKHFQIELDVTANDYNRFPALNHFAITVLLTYIKLNPKYKRLRKFIEEYSIAKIRYGQRNSNIDCESLLLFLDLISCPYLRVETKVELAKCFQVDEGQLLEICSVNKYWFTVWGDKFNLLRELDAKRSREVY